MRGVKKAVLLGLPVVGLLCIGAVWMFATRDDVPARQAVLVADAAGLKHTVVTPHLEAPITDGDNVLWCGTFQLAWNEACSLVGEDLHFIDEPPMVAILNKKAFTKQDIDAESYVALAGFVRDGIHERIERELEDTFQCRATPRLIPPKELTPRPQDIVAYAYLLKNLEFEVPFECIECPMVFAARQVPCFGIGWEYHKKHLDMLSQVVLWDYQDEDDFVVELKTTSDGDRLILAKTQPEATLAATVEAVLRRTANRQPTQAKIGDVLKVPKFNFDLTREYDELILKKLLVANPEIADDLWVFGAIQRIRFQFDEKGVVLESESHIAFSCGGPGPPPPERHIMIFDEPFLIMLQRRDAEVPYFAFWIANPELLVKVVE